MHLAAGSSLLSSLLLVFSALELRPAFVRALANLAIAYANQGLHEDAVRTYLKTLAHNPDAHHIWGYLRISLSHMQRDELVELSHVRLALHSAVATTNAIHAVQIAHSRSFCFCVLLLLVLQQKNPELFRPFFQF